jgi:hypothetical protein
MNDLREELEFILSEDAASIFISVPLAMGIVLGPWLMRQRKIKQERKMKCNKHEGLERKRCLINLEIAALKSEQTKLKQSVSQCSKHPEPKRTKCKKTIMGLVKDYDIKIAKQKKKIG